MPNKNTLLNKIRGYQGGAVVSPDYTFEERTDRLGIKTRLYNSVSPIAYSAKHAAKEFIAGERLPFMWNSEMTSFEDFEKHSMFKDTRIPPGPESLPYGEYVKQTSDDAWGMYLGFSQKNNTFRDSPFKKGAYSFNYEDDIWDDINHTPETKHFFDRASTGDTVRIENSPVGGFILDNYTVKKGFDKKNNLHYIEYNDKYDFDIPLYRRDIELALKEIGGYDFRDTGRIKTSIPAEKFVGKPFNISGRIYYDKDTREMIENPEINGNNKSEFNRGGIAGNNNSNTLLSLISGGRFKTSRDLPTIPEMAHSYIDQIIESYRQEAGTERKIVGEGLGLLEMVGPKLGMAALASPKKIIDTWRGVISKNKSVLETLQESLITIKKSNLPDLQKQEMVKEVGINAEALIRESGKQRQNIKSFEKFYDLMYPWSKKITKK